MVAQAAPVAGVYVAGAALLAGAAYLMTPAGQRTSESLGEAIYSGGENAVENIKSLFTPQTQSKAHVNTREAAADNTRQRNCDGPHRGRLQVQGYAKNIDPFSLELSQPWNRACNPPLKPEGFVMISTLLVMTQAVRYQSAGYRAAAFVKMSEHIASAPPMGFLAGYSIGFGMLKKGKAVNNLKAGRNPARVDLEVKLGRAFGAR